MTHMELGLQEIETRLTSDEIQAALDAIDSCIASYDNGELDGWELSLVKRKIAALQAPQVKPSVPEVVISKLYAIENGNAENVSDKDRVNIMRQFAKEALIELGIYHD